MCALPAAPRPEEEVPAVAPVPAPVAEQPAPAPAPAPEQPAPVPAPVAEQPAPAPVPAPEQPAPEPAPRPQRSPIPWIIGVMGLIILALLAFLLSEPPGKYNASTQATSAYPVRTRREPDLAGIIPSLAG